MPTHFHRRRVAPAILILVFGGVFRPESRRSGLGWRRRTRGRGRAGGVVPVVTTHVESKAVPVTIPAVGTAEAISERPDSSAGDRSAERRALLGRAGRHQRASRSSRSIRVRSRRRSSRRRPCSRATRPGEERQRAAARYENLFKRGLIPRDQYETQAASATALQATLAADQAASRDRRS